jgi:hypothetical protein
VTDGQEPDTSSSDVREDPGGRSRERLGIRSIVATAARTGWRNAWRILAVALGVSMTTVLAEIIADNFVDPNNELLSVGGTLSAQVASLFGTVILAGFLCMLVGQAHGGGQVTIRRVLRTLPVFRLIVADIGVIVLTLAGLVALLIPGLVIFNLLTVVGPVIEIERRSALSGLRRSAHLVRPRFWSVALLASVPQIALAMVESSLPDPHGVPATLEVLAVRGIAVAPIEAGIGLVLVALCYRLINLDAR